MTSRPGPDGPGNAPTGTATVSIACSTLGLHPSGLRLSRNRIIFWTVIAGAAAAAAHRFLLPLMPSDAPGDRVAQATGDNRPGHHAAEPTWTALPKRKTMTEPAGQLFFPPWTTPPPSAQPVHTPAAASKPAPPPMP